MAKTKNATQSQHVSGYWRKPPPQTVARKKKASTKRKKPSGGSTSGTKRGRVAAEARSNKSLIQARGSEKGRWGKARPARSSDFKTNGRLRKNRRFKR